MNEFFGFGGYTRTPEGFLSWQHLTLVTAFVSIMVALAIYFGLKNKNADERKKNLVLIWTAILIDCVEIFKIVIKCLGGNSLYTLATNLPLFLCSIQLITIPLAAFSRGRLREAALDFVFIFGLLGAVLGTYGAGNIYGVHPVLSFEPIVSGITHCMSGFASLYIGISGMTSMKKKNFPITLGILTVFCILAYLTNKLLPAYNLNYMFLMRGDGTPYGIFYDLVGGSPVLYPLVVVFLFYLYIFSFFLIFHAIRNSKKKRLTTT